MCTVLFFYSKNNSQRTQRVFDADTMETELEKGCMEMENKDKIRIEEEKKTVKLTQNEMYKAIFSGIARLHRF